MQRRPQVLRNHGLCDRGLTIADPFELLRKPATPRGCSRVLTDTEDARLINALPFLGPRAVPGCCQQCNWLWRPQCPATSSRCCSGSTSTFGQDRVPAHDEEGPHGRWPRIAG